MHAMRSLGAIDGWHFLDANKVWVLSGWAGATHGTGTRQRILSLQTNPRHYIKRPDAKNLELDLTGTGARVWLRSCVPVFATSSVVRRRRSTAPPKA